MGRGAGEAGALPGRPRRFERPEGWPIDVDRSVLPPFLYHVALSANREQIRDEGLDAGARTWNVGGPDLDHWHGEWLWYDFGDGPEPAEYRPEGVYVYGELLSAEECLLMYAEGRRGDEPRDIWQIETALLPGEIDVILDPASLRWDIDNVSAYVLERVPAEALTLLRTADR